jgi:hypothetical protein
MKSLAVICVIISSGLGIESRDVFVIFLFFLHSRLNVGRLFVYQVTLYANQCLFVLACSLESQLVVADEL